MQLYVHLLLSANIRTLRVLRDINQFAERRSSRGGVTRFFTHKTDASEIAQYRGKLNQAMGDFLVRLNSLLHSSEKNANVTSHGLQVKSQIYTHIHQDQMNKHKSEQLYILFVYVFA